MGIKKTKKKKESEFYRVVENSDPETLEQLKGKHFKYILNHLQIRYMRLGKELETLQKEFDLDSSKLVNEMEFIEQAKQNLLYSFEPVLSKEGETK